MAFCSRSEATSSRFLSSSSSRGSVEKLAHLTHEGLEKIRDLQLEILRFRGDLLVFRCLRAADDITEVLPQFLEALALGIDAVLDLLFRVIRGRRLHLVLQCGDLREGGGERFRDGLEGSQFLLRSHRFLGSLGRRFLSGGE